MNSRGTIVATMASLTLLAAAGLAPSATAAPQAPAKDSAAKSYIIKTKSASAARGVANAAEAAGGQITERYERVYEGFSAKLTAAQAQELRTNPKVESIIADQLAYPTTTQVNPTWGLDRIDQRRTAGNGTYSYTNTGDGVTAYVIDTGNRFSHNEFGGRAVSGFDFVDGGNADDCNGHGSHVSGTIGGSTYGVAKKVDLVAVRVFPCNDGAPFSTIIAAMDWVVANRTGPSVLNMSLGGGAFQPVDDAVANTTAAGVTVVVAAGNDNADACNTSPARAPSAITVAATDVNDTRAPFSNWGQCVDLFAPGVDVLSAWWDSDSATNTISGTSMAAPHVSGVVARHLQAHPADSPAQVTAHLLAATTLNKVVDPQGSPNRLLYIAPQKTGKPVIKLASAGSRWDTVVSVTGRWGKPIAGGPVDSYRVSAFLKSTGAKKKTVVVGPSALSKKVAGLKQNRKYYIRVSAWNSAGSGGNSKKSNTVKAR